MLGLKIDQGFIIQLIIIVYHSHFAPLGFCGKLVTSLVAQMVKHLPAMWETQVRSLGWEDPLEKEKATRSSTLAWNISWMEEPGRLPSMGLQRIRQDCVTSLLLLRIYRQRKRGQEVKKLA